MALPAPPLVSHDSPVVASMHFSAIGGGGGLRGGIVYRALSGLGMFDVFSWGVAPGWYVLAPLGQRRVILGRVIGVLGRRANFGAGAFPRWGRGEFWGG